MRTHNTQRAPHAFTHADVPSAFAFRPGDCMPRWEGSSQESDNPRPRAVSGKDVPTEMRDRDRTISRNERPSAHGCLAKLRPRHRRGISERGPLPPGKPPGGGRGSPRGSGLRASRKAAGAEAGGAARPGSLTEERSVPRRAGAGEAALACCSRASAPRGGRGAAPLLPAGSSRSGPGSSSPLPGQRAPPPPPRR